MVVNDELLGRMLDPIARCLTPDAARRLIGVHADPASQARMDELAEKRNEGAISDEELAEYASYVAAANVLGILQGKAKRLLNQGTPA